MLGLVLAVVGAGVWVGVQRLGYLEFGELRRVAQRTMERQVLINNLAIRRATEELKVSKDYAQISRVLMAAFSGNEFDAFDLRIEMPFRGMAALRGLQSISQWGEAPCFRWIKRGSHYDDQKLSLWSLNLELVSSRNHKCGAMTIYRLYTDRELQVDLNLLTSIFPVALSDAFERAAAAEVNNLPTERVSAVLAAHAS